MKRRAWPLWGSAGIIYLFLYAPIAVVIVYSFNAARHGGPWRGFTTEWYTKLLQSHDKLAAMQNTVIVAVLSTLISTVLGTALGFGLSRYRFVGKRVLSGLIYVPVVIPDIVMAVGMLMFYSFIREQFGILQLGLTTMTLAHVTFEIPFVAILVRARLAGLDPSLEEAAHDLGATAWQKFWHVTMPLAWPGIVAGAALAFTLSIDDFVVSFFTTGPGATTLPILIYSSVKRGVTPDINALSTLVLLCSIAGTILVTFLQGRGRSDRAR